MKRSMVSLLAASLVGLIVSACANVGPTSIQATNQLLDCYVVLLTETDCNAAHPLIAAVVPEANNLHRTRDPEPNSMDNPTKYPVGHSKPFKDWRVRKAALVADDPQNWDAHLLPQLMLVRSEWILNVLADYSQNLLQDNRGDRGDAGRLLLDILAIRNHLTQMHSEMVSGSPSRIHYLRAQAIRSGFRLAWNARGVEANLFIKTARGAASSVDVLQVLNQGRDLLWMALTERMVLTGYVTDLHNKFLELASKCYPARGTFVCQIDIANKKPAAIFVTEINKGKIYFKEACEPLAIRAGLDKMLCA